MVNRLFLFILVVVVSATFSQPSPVAAQGVADELKDQWLGEDCRSDPDSELCICAPAGRRTAVPLGDITYSSSQPGLPLSAASVGGDPADFPVFDPDEYRWIGEAADLEVVENSWFKRHCALAFFREDLTRAWYFAVALGSGFLSLSLVMAGVVYMQESASGSELAGARTRMFRIIIGMVILAMAFVFYEGIVSVLFGFTDFWTGDRAVFYQVLDSGG